MSFKSISFQYPGYQSLKIQMKGKSGRGEREGSKEEELSFLLYFFFLLFLGSATQGIISTSLSIINHELPQL